MINILLNHKTIRKYKSTPVEEEKLQKILEAAIRGSNTGNMQLYTIIITTDPEIKKQLWEAHFKQNMVLEAPVILTFIADINRFHKWCEINNAGTAYDNFLWFYNASIDAIIAAQNAAIAAESLELGICYLGTTTYNARKIIEILNLPYGTIPVTSLVVGYPDENPPLTDRLPLEGVIFYEKYQNYSPEQIKKIYEEKENLALYKELVKINGTENLAQIFTQKRYKKSDNVYFSKEFFEVLKMQGFFNQ